MKNISQATENIRINIENMMNCHILCSNRFIFFSIETDCLRCALKAPLVAATFTLV